MRAAHGRRATSCAAGTEIDGQQARGGHILIDVPFLEESPDGHSRRLDRAVPQIRIRRARLFHSIAPSMGQNAACVPTGFARVLQMRFDGYNLPGTWR